MPASRLAKKDGNGKAIANQYTITIAKNVPVGIYDAQVGGGQFGISNVRAFAVVICQK